MTLFYRLHSGFVCRFYAPARFALNDSYLVFIWFYDDVVERHACVSSVSPHTHTLTHYYCQHSESTTATHPPKLWQSSVNNPFRLPLCNFTTISLPFVLTSTLLARWMCVCVCAFIVVVDFDSCLNCKCDAHMQHPSEFLLFK